MWNAECGIVRLALRCAVHCARRANYLEDPVLLQSASDYTIPYSQSAIRNPQSVHSHSMVAGGLEVMSYTTRLTWGTSLTIRLEICASTLYGICAQSAVIPSDE